MRRIFAADALPASFSRKAINVASVYVFSVGSSSTATGVTTEGWDGAGAGITVVADGAGAGAESGVLEGAATGALEEAAAGALEGVATGAVGGLGAEPDGAEDADDAGAGAGAGWTGADPSDFTHWK